jgi:large subunit ribosomal protein L30
MAAQTVRVIQRRSTNGTSPNQRETLRSLGLRGIGKSVEKEDGPVLRGMVRVVGHLVEVEEVSAAKKKKSAAKEPPVAETPEAKPEKEGQDG